MKSSEKLSPIAVAISMVLSSNSVLSQEFKLQEIIVTAQKRSQGVQDVPVSVDAYSQESLREKGVLSVTDLTDVNPSVSFAVAGGQGYSQSSLSIRGIGTFGQGRSFEGAVGTYVDGAYRSRPFMAVGEMLDIGQLEVLKGPQGTLFGKNTVAGAITLESVTPSFDSKEGSIGMRFGNEGEERIDVAYNQPLNDTAAVRVSGVWHERDGYLENQNSVQSDLASIDRYAFKANFLTTPTDDLSIQFVADYSNSTGLSSGATLLGVDTTNPLAGLDLAVQPALAGANGLALPFWEVGSSDATKTATNTNYSEETEDQGILLNITWDFDRVWSLKSTTSYRTFDNLQDKLDPDYGPLDIFVITEDAEIDNFSQEFNVSGEIGNADIILGLFYAQEELKASRLINAGAQMDDYIGALYANVLGPLNMVNNLSEVGALVAAGMPVVDQIEVYEQESDSYSAYFHSSTDLTDDFTIVFGARYGVEEKEGGVPYAFTSQSPETQALVEVTSGLPAGTLNGVSINGLGLLGALAPAAFETEQKDEEWAATLALQYVIANDINSYLNLNHGYKAGGVNLEGSAVALNNKTYAPEYADSVEVGLKAQYWGGRARTNVAVFYTEYSDFQFNYFNGAGFLTVNAPKAISQGIELEGEILVTERLKLSYATAYIDATFDEINVPELSYLEDRRAPRSPSFSGLISIDYSTFVSDGWELYSRGSASYTGSHFAGSDLANESKQDSYTIYNAALGLRSDEMGLDVSLFCENCTDERYLTNNVLAPLNFATLAGYVSSPRYFGLNARYSF